MDGPDLFSALPIWAFVLVALCLVGLIASAGMAVFAFFFQAGVAINEARKPPHLDAGDYRLDQGREVRPEQEQATRNRKV